MDNIKLNELSDHVQFYRNISKLQSWFKYRWQNKFKYFRDPFLKSVWG